MEKMNIAVIGSGVFGLTSAVELARRGHRVTVLDRGGIPSPDSASYDISKFVRMDYGRDELYMSMMEEAIPLWRKWSNALDKPLYRETGALFMVSGEMKPGGFEYESFTALREKGYPLERLDSAKIRKLLPGVKYRKFNDGYLNPGCGWADAVEVMKVLAAEAAGAGALLRAGDAVCSIETNVGAVSGVVTVSGEKISADIALVAAGAWSANLVPGISDLVTVSGQPIFYLKPGPDIKFQSPERPLVWLADILQTGWYGFPALPDGTIKISNHGEGVAFDPSGDRMVTQSQEESFREFIAANMPSLSESFVVKSRLCPYTVIPDNDFIIDWVPGSPGVVAATGGSGHAFKFAPVLGRLIADVVERKPNRFSHRFKWRKPGDSALATKDL